jgi:hypothetical protein
VSPESDYIKGVRIYCQHVSGGNFAGQPVVEALIAQGSEGELDTHRCVGSVQLILSD